MLLNEVATARLKRELADLRRKIAAAEEATVAMQELTARTPDDEMRIAEGLAAIREAKASAEVLERFAEGAYSIEVANADDDDR